MYFERLPRSYFFRALQYCLLAYRPVAFCNAVLLTLVICYSTNANQPFFMGLGTPLASYVYSSRALGVSADGSVVVGWQNYLPFGSTTQITEAFRWTMSDGRVALDLTYAWDVSDDGSVVIGGGRRWSSDVGVTDIGGATYGVSGDGLVIVGIKDSDSGNEASRWTRSDGLVGLGDLDGGIFDGRANGASADGSVIVGYSNSALRREAFRWTSEGGMVGLGSIVGGVTSNNLLSAAEDVSADGSVVVGASRSSLTSTVEAFRWTSSGGMVGLGALPGGVFHSGANGVSGDGSGVVGFSGMSPNNQAFLWDAVHGMRGLHDLLADDLGLNVSNWNLEIATNISADGRTVIGYGINPQGVQEGWIAYLGSPIPEPTSFVLAAISLAAAVGKSQRRRISITTH